MGEPPAFQRDSRNGAVLGGSPSLSLLPRVTRFGLPMDTFRRLGAPTPISLNDELSFNNNNNLCDLKALLACPPFYNLFKNIPLVSGLKSGIEIINRYYFLPRVYNTYILLEIITPTRQNNQIIWLCGQGRGLRLWGSWDLIYYVDLWGLNLCPLFAYL